MKRIIKILKNNLLTVYIYNKYLDYRCAGVKAYIFVATIGRTGTDSLSKIFKVVDEMATFHGPHPIMLNNYSANVNKQNYFDDLFYRLKRVYIKRAAIGKRYYLETNHMFVKIFYIKLYNILKIN